MCDTIGRLECLVSGTLAAVLRVSRFAAIAPLRFKKQHDGWRIRNSSTISYCGNSIVTTINILFLGTVIAKEVIYPKSGNEDGKISGSNIAKVCVDLWKDFMAVLISTVMVYDASRQMRNLMTALKQLEEIKTMLKIHRLPSPWSKKLVLLVISWAIATFTLCIPGYALQLFTVDEMWSRMIYLYFHVNFFMMQLRKMQFVMMVLHVRSGFQAVNDCLGRLLHGPAPERAMGVRQLARAYGMSCDLVSAVNSSHGPLVLLFLGSSVVYIIVTAYYFTLALIKNSMNMSQLVMYETMQISWCCFQVLDLMAIIEPCHLTYVEMDVTCALVSQFLRRRHSYSVYDPLEAQLHHFCTIISLDHVTYQPFNAITMKRSLLIYVIGSIIVYLLILLKNEF